MSAQPEHKPAKYEINIEGRLFAWDQPTIPVSQLRELGGLPSEQPVLEVNLQTNEERTIPEAEIVELKPGHGFAKKVSFKRG